MYNEIKIDQDRSHQKLFKTQKNFDDAQNQRELLEQKLKRLEENQKAKDEQIKTLRTQKEKFEGQCRVLNEQLDLI